ncbi:glutathione synthase/RimK-type ligase-like ATP-grasp enzyme [Paenibacillus shirakamiensis]|uniref:Glutathione synthase/RimK-type ligase-like ATP-grasp enzyme n=1 Tax=Paenibacillus shirakamiensis TaxID=1265935 RepID=A0ABS4JLH0_9BACL|nr:YheC/YheD family protein [Paenibacillus shirakamiensis]MBP2002553.1 glutathione synthase/RimK-type ligase-like ATP-grasp enzyme [Paenibacillus shirakamiensis]
MPQPVLGILTLYMNANKQLEERPIYQRMITEGMRMGLDVFVFTPADVHSTKPLIHAMMYDPKTKKWSRKWRPFPALIFDRCRIQRSVRFEQLKKFRSRYGHLHFLNRPLRDKWTIHQILSKKSRFRSHLPDTVMFTGLSDVTQLLKNNATVYMKPINGTGGRGILRIEKAGTQLYKIQGRNQKRNIIAPQKVHPSRLGPYLMNWRSSTRYIVQQGIQIELPNGRVHDYRMLVQKNGSGVWSVTGCAGRIGAQRSVTSNLHGGGHAVQMNTQLKYWFQAEEKRHAIRKEAEKLSLDIAEYLEDTYGALCELALDLAIDKSGHIYVLEVNPKPAREVFKRSGDAEAYRNAIIRPLEYAMWLHKKKNSNQTVAE